MNLDELTVGEIKKLAAMFSNQNLANESAFVAGTRYLIRTVTMYHVGLLVRVTPNELVLDNASWVADTGRFGVALKTGRLGDTEYMGDGVIVSRGALVDAGVWVHDLPK